MRRSRETSGAGVSAVAVEEGVRVEGSASMGRAVAILPQRSRAERGRHCEVDTTLVIIYTASDGVEGSLSGWRWREGVMRWGPQVDARGGWTDLQTSDRALMAKERREVGSCCLKGSAEICRSRDVCRLEGTLMDWSFFEVGVSMEFGLPQRTCRSWKSLGKQPSPGATPTPRRQAAIPGRLRSRRRLPSSRGREQICFEQAIIDAAVRRLGTSLSYRSAGWGGSG